MEQIGEDDEIFKCNVNDKMTLTLSTQNRVSSIERHTCAAFAVHPDFKSHAGATMNFEGGKGGAESVSMKQKLNATVQHNSRISGSG